jgi:hypothetical protein
MRLAAFVTRRRVMVTTPYLLNPRGGQALWIAPNPIKLTLLARVAVIGEDDLDGAAK